VEGHRSGRLGRKSARRFGGRLASKGIADEAAGRGELPEIDAGADAEPVEQVEHVLARDIPGGAGTILRAFQIPSMPDSLFLLPLFRHPLRLQ